MRIVIVKKFYSNLSFKNHSNSALSKMANAIRSLYLVQNQIPLKSKSR